MSPRTMYDKVELDDAAKVRFTNDGYLVATPTHRSHRHPTVWR